MQHICILHSFYFLPINDVGLSDTGVKAGIINIVRNEVVKYSKNPIYILQDCSLP